MVRKLTVLGLSVGRLIGGQSSVLLGCERIKRGLPRGDCVKPSHAETVARECWWRESGMQRLAACRMEAWVHVCACAVS
eukprot:11540961-Alexandrium_andersonii.AAC.1